MTTAPLHTPHRSPDRPAGNLYRVTAAVVALSVVQHQRREQPAIPVALALLPTVVVSGLAFPKVPLAALPPVMPAAAVITVVIVRRRITRV